MSEFTLEAALEVAEVAVGSAVGAEAMFRLRRELENLRRDSKILDNLCAEGVDNWPGYSYALSNIDA